jgi:death-on-curing protein
VTDWEWVEKEVVLAMHDQLLADYGGSEGILSMGGLEGALGRPQNLASYGDPEPDIADLAAVYAVGIAKAHAFVDANKRTAWATARTFLLLNGYGLNLTEIDRAAVVALMENVARGKVDETTLAPWFHARLASRR